jgi:DNA-directed RNA polymerase subunit M/transcription elongation factor TFIIS
MARRGRCRCGVVLSFRKGPEGYKMRCPSCGSVVRLTTAAARSGARPAKPSTSPAVPVSESPARELPAAAGELVAGRTVTCEACHTLVSAEVARCPECGSSLALTAAAPALDAQLASLGAPVPKRSADRQLLGWLAAGVAVMLVVLAVVLVSLRH